ncbi:class I SAM-dependent methyltransferase (plasmid) [Phyllobacterium sp. 628]|uniref:class I SAM-dependent methyltransferase n=1 Tax=Phyllobacterium sp. 628 TaxID=2718938 RepID=UPI0016624CE5|nr:class I SAM-dependent methyltransferase [Phyllobacterium sp. 628]QND54769.1 class I SAM-dependent methyltransferase [Phyllobacterium sp. 628]
MSRPRFIARQFARPSGFLGRFIAMAMNYGNASMNAFAVEKLEADATDRILEVGFGGGVTLPSLLEKAGFVAGVDRSPDMVARAKKMFAGAIASKRAEFHEGNVETLPFLSETFTKVCTVNTVYFWPSLDVGFEEIYRVLASGGRLVIGFLPKERMDLMQLPTDVFTARTVEEIVASLTRTGFGNVRVERPESTTAWCVVVGMRQ